MTSLNMSLGFVSQQTQIICKLPNPPSHVFCRWCGSCPVPFGCGGCHSWGQGQGGGGVGGGGWVLSGGFEGEEDLRGSREGRILRRKGGHRGGGGLGSSRESAGCRRGNKRGEEGLCGVEGAQART